MDTSIFRQTRPQKTTRQKTWPHLFAIGSSAGAFGITVLLYPSFPYAPRLLLYCAVLASSRFGGAWPGIIAAVLTTALSSLFVGPAAAQQTHWLEEWTALSGYFAASLLSVAVISQLRNRETILKEKDAQLNDFMENASVGLQWLATDGTILWTNPATREILGCIGPAECKGRRLQDFCAEPKDAATLLRRLAANERLQNYEIRLRTTSGSVRLVLIDANVLSRNGAIVHARCFLRDITARKAAEEDLANERNLLRTLIDALPDAIYTKDRESRFLISNAANMLLLGAKDEEQLRNKSVKELCPSDIARKFIKDDREVIENGRHYFDREEAFREPDGTERTLLTTKLPLRDVSGSITGLVGISKDITERKQVEASIRESEERFRVLFEHSPEPIFILDPNDPERILPVVDCNEAAGSQHGYRRDELKGQPFGLIETAARSRARAEAFVQRVRTEGMVKIETLHRHKGGHTFLLEIWASFITVSHRELMLCMARDISARKKSEEAIRRSNEQLEARVCERTRQLEQANRELESFSYSISHDLRAPVRSIRGFAQIIHEDHGKKLDGEAVRLFKFIVDSAVRMDELITDLLAFSNLIAHQMSRSHVDMRELAESVIAESLDSLGKPAVVIELADLPATAGDRSLLRQVLANLVGNALKFSSKATRPRIEIGACEEEDVTTYFVRDNGVGFNMNYASKLFQVFQRLHNPEQFEGTGIGLAIVHRIIQRHGGKVWAESAPNAGATFYFSLPTATSLPHEPHAETLTASSSETLSIP